MTMDDSELCAAHRKLFVRMGLQVIDQDRAGAVHRLDGEVFPVDHGGVHIVLIMIPVTGGLPEGALHDLRRGDFNIVPLLVYLTPVVNQGIAKNHALRQIERESGCFIAEGEKAKLLAELAVVTLLCFFKLHEISIKFLCSPEGNTVDAGKHFVFAVVFPVRARLLGDLEGLEGLGIGQVRSEAHVHVLALLEETELCLVRQIGHVLNLIFLTALFHELSGLFARKDEGFDRQILLGDLLHFLLDGLEILIGQFGIAQIHVIIEAVLRGRTECKVRLRIQTLDGLCHDMGCSVAKNVQFFFLRAFADRTVFVNDFHRLSS